MELILTLKKNIMVPVEMDKILPEKVQDLSKDEIKNIELPQGRTTITVEELFNIEVKESETPRVVIKNSTPKLKRIGEKMTSGEIVVEGDAGMYVGAEMKGGKIVVNGNADSWVGQNMKGGEIIIKGDAKDYVGSAYRGDWRGMSGGTITVEGNAGSELGEFMKGGLIHIKGNVDIHAGIHQSGGIIIIDGDADGRAGGEMVKGAIVINGKVKDLMPSFKFEGIVENPVIKLSKKDAGTPITGKYYKFIGDYAKNKPKGQLYISVENNPNLR
ncbi:tungsten-dependent formylmethanofuran dehydrogenase subunit FwdC [Methanothermococcus okinawensis]|uniref:Tungsten-containing formylmethanofuran dehydrogenase 2 subunit C n=1 Tax=Methanothermococcus okinawensis (strain DSM 14208 / JCM 11175 / IH1) TaxID=647113 RepID=F8AME9_METOI|nr:tungsten-dependent formylmethanofuran dehydrogenase subunit FwdC [Methanothermococcus okinawensis]AEH06845.1 formylmethanofuran dehydrogenase subunit C [Methanothermococcus okinawensis IH1]